MKTRPRPSPPPVSRRQREPDDPSPAEVLELVLAGYWDWNIPTGEEFLSPAFKRMFGYSDHELPNRPESWQNLIFSEDLPGVMARFEEHIATAGQVPFYNEVRYHHRDGSTIWVMCSGRVIAWGPQGEPLRMIGCHIDITHLKSQSVELARLSMVAAKTTNGVIITDGRGITEWVNEEFLRQTGYRSEEVIGKKPGDVLQGPDTDFEAVGRIRNAIASKQPIEETLLNYRRTGEKFWVRMKIDPVRDDQGNEHFIAIQSEVTAQRMAEEALRESEERLREVLDAATGVSMIATDRDGLITFFSRGSEALLGYSAEEIVGHASPAIFHDPNEVEKRSRKLSVQLGREISGFDVFTALPLLQGKERREWSYICRDASRKVVDLTVTVSRDSAGAITGFLGTAVDITSRKRMESDLRSAIQAERTALSLLEAGGRIARLGYWEVALDQPFPIWSDITCEIHDLPPGTKPTLEQAISFYEGEAQQIIRNAVQGVIETGKPFDVEVQLTTARKRRIWIHSRGEAIRDDSGRVTGLRGVIQDVDESHRASALLEQKNRELEVATAEAEANARAKAEFLANMSHEIRTPLNAIIGMSELLLDHGVDGRPREFVETIRSSGDTLLAVINDILDFSKIESGQLELEDIPFDLRDCVESALDLASTSAGKKKLDLLYWIDPAVPAMISGDITRLRQVIVNLVVNGVKFTSEGEVFVRVTPVTDPAGKDRLRVAVRDSGIGIPLERRDRLFQAFSQIDATTTRRFGGTGLGLAICRRLVDIMHGRIWVDSEPGQGATFSFEIPFSAIGSDAGAAQTAGTPVGLAGRRILIVDDNATSRWVLETQIAAWGLAPRSTGDSADVTARLSAGETFDAVILDAPMPAVDLPDLAADLRQSIPGLPLLLLTARGDTTHDHGVAGPLEILTKPIKNEALLEALGRLILGTPSSGGAMPQRPKEKLATACPLKILVAEDVPVNQRVITLLLDRLGYRAVVVANGVEVLHALDRGHYDVILLDLHMPEMDGLEAAREICRRQQPDERPRLIALTAAALSGDRESCLAAGMDDYLSKPVRTDKLSDALSRAHRALAERANPQ